MPELHFCDGGPLTVQYLLVVDALNFCFWPDGELEYEHLAGGIKVRRIATAAAAGRRWRAEYELPAGGIKVRKTNMISSSSSSAVDLVESPAGV
jgi:hypothetical protein